MVTVELFLNGQSLGEKTVDRNSRLEWKIAYVPGELLAIARKEGVEAARKVNATTGNPSRIQLEPNTTIMNANGCDTIMVRVSLLDNQGRVVPTADNEVEFTIEGPGKLIGVGNGNPSSHEPDKSNRRRAFNGHCLAIIQASESKGDIVLKAASPSLRSVTVVLETR